jgi:hypothetical protein
MSTLTYLEILRAYSASLDLGKHSLSNAETLAEGTLPLIVLMQEPCNQADRVPYDAMVYGDPDAENWTHAYKDSAALQEIECLTGVESCEEYDLRDLHVFDLNTLSSPRIQSKSHNLNGDIREAHKTCWKMIKAKKPKVILVLTTRAGGSKNSGLRQLKSSLSIAGSTSTINIEGHEIRVIHGFHPSMYLRDDYVSENNWSPQEVNTARDVLHFCVAQALAFLEDDCNVLVNDDLFKRWRKLVGPRQSFCNLEGDVGCNLLWEEFEALGI